MLGAGSASLAAGVCHEQSLDLVPVLSINDGFMLAFVAAILVRYAADVNRIRKDAVEVSAAERSSSRLRSVEHRAKVRSPRR